MESYQLSFNATPTGAKKNLPASGDLFVYESASVATGAETRIKVKPSNGNTIILKPGQRFRNPDPVTDWAMETYNGNDVIDAVFIIGFGEFDDANTLNKVTLDASFANVVTVANTTANRVPVSLDTNQTINVSSAIVAYQTSYTSMAVMAANTAMTVVAPASNVNGILVNRSMIAPDANGYCALLAKAGTPATVADGDCLNYTQPVAAGTPSVEDTQIKVPAGRGLYFISNGVHQNMRSVLYTVL